MGEGVVVGVENGVAVGLGNGVTVGNRVEVGPGGLQATSRMVTRAMKLANLI